MKPRDKIVDGMKQLHTGAKKFGHDAKDLTKLIFTKPLDAMKLKNFVPAVRNRASQKMNPEEEAFLASVVREHSDFVLSHLTDLEIKMLIEAMEKYTVSPGDTIINQGDLGDFLYVLKEGSLRYLVDGTEVGRAGPGDIFGELALLYDTPRAATVIADNHCHLYRVHRETFRMIQASYILNEDDETRNMLKQHKLFENLPDGKIREIASYLFQKKFYKGDVLIKKGELVEVIYFLKQGRVLGRDISVNETTFKDVEAKQGESFGERAIIMNAPAIATAECLTDGVAYVLTKERFLHAMEGMNIADIIEKSMETKLLRLFPFFVNSDISDLELLQMAKKLERVTLEPGEVLATIGENVDSAIYFIALESKEAAVEATLANGQHMTFKVSEPFGFGKGQLMTFNIDEVDCEAAVQFAKENNFVNFETDEGIHAEKKKILETFMVTSQATMKGIGTKTIHLRRLTLRNIVEIIHDPLRLGRFKQDELVGENSVTYDKLEKKRLLGQGSFGQVWLCRDPSHDLPYALKIQYKRELIEQHQAEGVIRETSVMRNMHHPFVMGLVDAQQDPERLYMTMKLIQGGELRDQMRNKDWPHLSEPAAKFYAACIIEGLSYMHRRNYIYRDLKGENVLVDKDGYCVIIDLGFAKYVPDRTFTFCGTPIFICPEILLNKGHDKSADLWSYGVLIYEMLFGTNPFFDYDDPNIDQNTLFKRIVKGSFQRPKKQTALDAYANTSTEAKDLIKKLLQVKRHKRIGCMANADLDIRNHPWFEDIDWGKLYRKEIEAPWIPDIADPFDGTNFKSVEEKSKSGLKKLTNREQKMFENFC